MSNYNKVILMGRLTRDPQLKYLSNQTAVTEFGMAVNRKYGGKDGAEAREEVLFIDCTAWGKQAELIAENCTKGQSLHLDGRLKFETWEDKQSGSKRNKITLVVESFQYVGSSGGGDGNADGGGQHANGTGRPAPRSAHKGRAPQGDFPEHRPVPDDDIPF